MSRFQNLQKLLGNLMQKSCLLGLTSCKNLERCCDEETDSTIKRRCINDLYFLFLVEREP